MGTQVLMDACAQCGATGQPQLRCGQCRGVIYCSGKCQRAHWSAHKAACRTAAAATVTAPAASVAQTPVLVDQVPAAAEVPRERSPEGARGGGGAAAAGGAAAVAGAAAAHDASHATVEAAYAADAAALVTLIAREPSTNKIAVALFDWLRGGGARVRAGAAALVEAGVARSLLTLLLVASRAPLLNARLAEGALALLEQLLLSVCGPHCSQLLREAASDAAIRTLIACCGTFNEPAALIAALAALHAVASHGGHGDGCSGSRCVRRPPPQFQRREVDPVVFALLAGREPAVMVSAALLLSLHGAFDADGWTTLLSAGAVRIIAAALAANELSERADEMIVALGRLLHNAVSEEYFAAMDYTSHFVLCPGAFEDAMVAFDAILRNIRPVVKGSAEAAAAAETMRALTFGWCITEDRGSFDARLVASGAVSVVIRAFCSVLNVTDRDVDVYAFSMKECLVGTLSSMMPANGHRCARLVEEFDSADGLDLCGRILVVAPDGPTAWRAMILLHQMLSMYETFETFREARLAQCLVRIGIVPALCATLRGCRLAVGDIRLKAALQLLPTIVHALAGDTSAVVNAPLVEELARVMHGSRGSRDYGAAAAALFTVAQTPEGLPLIASHALLLVPCIVDTVESYDLPYKECRLLRKLAALSGVARSAMVSVGIFSRMIVCICGAVSAAGDESDKYICGSKMFHICGLLHDLMLCDGSYRLEFLALGGARALAQLLGANARFTTAHSLPLVGAGVIPLLDDLYLGCPAGRPLFAVHGALALIAKQSRRSDGAIARAWMQRLEHTGVLGWQVQHVVAAGGSVRPLHDHGYFCRCSVRPLDPRPGYALRQLLIEEWGDSARTPGTADVVIRFYDDGFTVNDGGLAGYGDDIGARLNDCVFRSARYHDLPLDVLRDLRGGIVRAELFAGKTSVTVRLHQIAGVHAAAAAGGGRVRR